MEVVASSFASVRETHRGRRQRGNRKKNHWRQTAQVERLKRTALISNWRQHNKIRNHFHRAICGSNFYIKKANQRNETKTLNKITSSKTWLCCKVGGNHKFKAKVSSSLLMLQMDPTWWSEMKHMDTKYTKCPSEVVLGDSPLYEVKNSGRQMMKARITRRRSFVRATFVMAVR